MRSRRARTEIDILAESLWLEIDTPLASPAKAADIYPDSDDDAKWPLSALLSPTDTLSPGLIVPALSPARLLAFEKTFSAIASGFCVASIEQVVKSVNKEGISFLVGEAWAALRNMQEKGQVRLWGGRVYMPEAWELVK